MGIKYRDNSIVGAFTGPTPIRDVYAGDSLMWHNYLYDWQYSTNNGNVTLTGYNGSYEGIVTVPTAEQVGSNIKINAITFRNNPNLTAVDLQNVPFVDFDMSNAFRNCQNLTSIENIPVATRITSYAFSNCHNLDQDITFSSATQFMNFTFVSCRNFKSNVTIQSSSVQTAFGCFANTFLRKNVYFPFNYTGSRVRTPTFNAFKNAGYVTTSGGSTEKDYVRVYNLPLTRGMRFDPPDDER